MLALCWGLHKNVCAGTRRAKQQQGNEAILEMAMREARVICEDVGATDERTMVAVRNGVLRGMTIAEHEAVSRLSQWVGK